MIPNDNTLYMTKQHIPLIPEWNSINDKPMPQGEIVRCKLVVSGVDVKEGWMKRKGNLIYEGNTETPVTYFPTHWKSIH